MKTPLLQQMNKSIYIDLTHTLQNSISTFPGTPPPVITPDSTVQKDGYAITNLHLQSHHGTHMDAPSHFVLTGKSVDQLDVSHFIGRGIVIKLEEGKEINLEEIPEGIQWVLFNTGWSKSWKTQEYQKPFPTISQYAALELVKRKIKGVGVDSLSIDRIQSEHFPIHHILLKENIIIVENLTNLEELIGKEFEFISLPLKIIDCDGSPVRAIARIIQK